MPYALRVTFGDWGDPLLHPEITAMFAYARDNRIATSASTNLHALKTEDDIRNLAENGPTWELMLSLHGGSQETYEIYQPGKNFAETMEKIKTLVRIRKELNKSRPELNLVFAISKKNQHEIPEMKRLARELGARCRMYTASVNVRLYRDPQETRKLVETWAQDAGWDQFDNYDFVNKRRITDFYSAIRNNEKVDDRSLEQQKLTGRHFCDEPWRSLTVNWNGTICLCCTDYSKYCMGDIREQSLLTIWNNQEYMKVRSYFLRERDRLPVGHPCAHCLPY